MRLKLMIVAASVALLAAMAAPSFASAGVDLRAKMNGNKIVGGKGSRNGSGKAFLHLNARGQRACFTVRWRRIHGIGGLNIGVYTGAKGQNGDEVIELVGKPQGSPAGGCVTVASDLVRQIRRNPRSFHVNIKNNRFNRTGAIRGQLKAA
jgi:hypothetical protein